MSYIGNVGIMDNKMEATIGIILYRGLVSGGEFRIEHKGRPGT